MFTPGQVSDMLDVPSSTLRRYVKQFAAHLSETATKKRGRRFTERDVATLARARELLQQGRKPPEVNELLPVLGKEDPEAQPDAALALVPSISAALTEALDLAHSLRAEVGDLAGQVEQVAQDQGATREELAELRKWLRLPWYRRLRTPPPSE